MAKQGFRRNAKTIAMILKTVDGGKRAAADKILAALPADADARIDIYQTDREVIGVVVPGYKQAKDGIATRAASAAGMSQGRP
jgi:hypothetical protein